MGRTYLLSLIIVTRLNKKMTLFFVIKLINKGHFLRIAMSMSYDYQVMVSNVYPLLQNLHYLLNLFFNHKLKLFKHIDKHSTLPQFFQL